MKEDKNIKWDLSKILDALPFYVLLIDRNHKIVFANKAITSLYNIGLEDIIGGFCPKVIHCSEEPIPHCPLEEAIEKNECIEREYYDESSEKWMSSAIYPSAESTKDGSTVYVHMVHDISLRKNAEEEVKKSLCKTKRLMDSGIQALAATVEYRDPYTAGHQLHVSILAGRIAQEMGLSVEEREGIRLSGFIHDLGKIAVPIEILSKPGKITPLEMGLIRLHSEAGYNILKNIEFPWPVAETVLQHHERLDGSGYPRGLAGDQISLAARIISVADVVEAMQSHRPYRPSLGKEKAMEEIRNNRGRLYDPDVVDVCWDLFQNKGFNFENEC